MTEDIESVPDTPKKRRKAKTAKETSIVPDGSVAKFPRERFLEFVAALRIQSKDSGLVPLRFLGSQSYLLDEIEEGLNRGITTFVILKNRQAGISTFFLALDMFWAQENNGLLGIFATHEEASREQFRNQINVFFNNLPSKYKISIKTNNKYMLVFDPPCSSIFQYMVAGTRAATNKMGRSGGGNYLHSTETAFYGSYDDIKALNQTLSEKYAHRAYFFESTANGFNHFHEMWETSLSSPAQKAIFVGWWRDERNEFGPNHPLYLAYMPEGTKTALTPHERKMVKAVREEYGFQITAGQLGWYRHHLETKCGNDLNQMMQEMPATAEDAFRSTGSQFFTNEAITAMVKDARRYPCRPFQFRVTTNPRDTLLQGSRIEQASLKIWDMPSPLGKYVIGCDPAFGSNPESDNSSISVGRAFADCIVQVAEFASNSVQPYQLAWILAYICGLYGDVFLILEMNGAGLAVHGELEKLREGFHGVAVNEGDTDFSNCLRHMKHYLYRREDSLSGGLLKQWVMSPNNKEHLMETYKTGFETGSVRIRSMQGLEEHRKIVRDEGTIGGAGRARDDRVIAPALMYYAWNQWIRRKLMSAGKTMEKEMKIERHGGPDPATKLLQKFLMMKNIRVTDQIEE